MAKYVCVQMLDSVDHELKDFPLIATFNWSPTWLTFHLLSHQR